MAMHLHHQEKELLFDLGLEYSLNQIVVVGFCYKYQYHQAFVHQLDIAHEGRVRPALRAVHDDALVLLGGRHELPPFPDAVRHRFLDVHVLAGLAAPDRRERMPVVRRRDRDGVNLLVFHDLP